MDADTPKILVVENDEGVRNVIKVGLIHYGFTVVLASSGEEALELVQEHKFDAVLLDVKMPDMSGPETAIELQKIQPEIPFFYMTGSSELTKEELPGAVEVFPKPLASFEATAKRIAEVLGKS